MAVTDPASRIERLIRRAEATLAEEIAALVATIQSEATLAELAELIQRGDVEGAFRILDRATRRLGIVWSQQFVLAGEDTSRFLNRALGEIIIDFDLTNSGAVAVMQENQLRLVAEFTAAQRRATREALTAGIEAGANPIQQARAFRESIGLTAHQERAVQNYQRALENLDRDALRRQLRDRRSDPTVRRAIEEGKPLSGKQVQKLVKRYRERFRAHRARVIARTEALRSTHMGAKAMYDQAIESGQLLPEQLVQIWNTALDERVRSSHAAMHSQERPIGLPFTSGVGNSLRFPGDPSAPGAETIQCRCALGTRILSLDELPSLAGVTLIGAA